MQQVGSSVTGRSAGASAEEEAFTRLVKVLRESGMKKPTLLMGWRQFSTWVEILSGTSVVGSEASNFRLSAEKGGQFRFTLSSETVNTRSALAWQVAEQVVSVIRSKMLGPDELHMAEMADLMRSTRQ